MTKLFLSLNRRRKKKRNKKNSDRSEFLRMLFGYMSGDRAESISRYAVNGDVDRFNVAWDKLTAHLKEQVKAIQDEKIRNGEISPDAVTAPAEPVSPAQPVTPAQAQTVK
jgi:hypothetical protein